MPNHFEQLCAHISELVPLDDQDKKHISERFGIELGEDEDNLDPSKCKCRTDEVIKNEIHASNDPSKCKCRTATRRAAADPSKCKCRTSEN